MKAYLKKLLTRLGYTLYNPDNLPYGINLMRDLNMILPSQKIKTVFDVGANIGQTAQYFSHSFPEANIFSFEPISSTFNQLKENTKYLKLVQIFNYALGAEEGTCEIFVEENSVANSLITDLNQVNASLKTLETVTIKTLDQVVKQQNIQEIDLLKTDTEGFDLEVLKGAKDCFSQGKIKLILAEVGLNPQDKQHTFFCSIYEYLLEKDFRFYAFYDSIYHGHKGKAKGLYYANALFIHPNCLG